MRWMSFLFLITFFTFAIFVWPINLPFTGKEVTNEVKAADAEKITDPVCGMEINKEGAMVLEIEGKSFYFCSDDCEAKFKENPGKFQCICFAGLKEGDEPCDCPHCSGKAAKCDCAEHHGHPHEHEHGHES